MRTLILIYLLSIFSIASSGQSFKIDSCIVDTSRKLNKYEINYFRENIRRLKLQDISDKNFAFTYGNFGKTVINKKEYFERWGIDYYNRNIEIFNILIELTSKEKQQSGGFDYIIVSWSKMLPAGKSRKKLIEKVRKYSKINSHL